MLHIIYKENEELQRPSPWGQKWTSGTSRGLVFWGSIFAPDKLSIPKFMLLTVCN